LFQAVDKAIATNDDVVVVAMVLLRSIIFVNSAPKTSDKKATNGECHTMLKVNQHGVTITEL
jgi:hypothetical protein